MELWVGTYTEDIVFGTGKVLKGKGRGICRLELDPVTMKVKAEEINEGIVNPSYLALSPDGRFLFAVNELKHYQGMSSGAVSSYSIDSSTRTLKWISTQPSHGTDPCHLMVNADGSLLFVANFMSGSIAWYPLGPDGTIGEALSWVQHAGFSVDPARQQGPHAHAVVMSPDERFLFVPDLGLDRIVVYGIDRVGNKLVPREDLSMTCAPGAGPRQLVFHKKLPFVYVVNELNSTIEALSYDPASGRLSRIATVSTLPTGYMGSSTCADIHISTNGKYLFASNRGHDSLAGYRISPADGTLEFLGTTSTAGACPRNFTLSGEYCIVANQDSDSIVAFSLDENTGELLRHGESIGIPTPVCIIGA